MDPLAHPPARQPGTVARDTQIRKWTDGISRWEKNEDRRGVSNNATSVTNASVIASGVIYFSAARYFRDVIDA